MILQLTGKPLRLLIAIQPGYHYEFGAKSVCLAMSTAIANQTTSNANGNVFDGVSLQIDDWRADYPYYGRAFASVTHSLYISNAAASNSNGANSNSSGGDDGGPIVAAVQTFGALSLPQSARVLVVDSRGARCATMHGRGRVMRIPHTPQCDAM